MLNVCLIPSTKLAEFKDLCDIHGSTFEVMPASDRYAYVYNHYYTEYDRMYKGFNHEAAKSGATQSAGMYNEDTVLVSMSYADTDKYTVLAYAHNDAGAVDLHSFDPDFNFKSVELNFNTCNECNVNRERVKTYFIRDNSTGAVFQVGGSCAKLYDAEKLVRKMKARLESFSDFSESCGLPGLSHDSLNPVFIAGFIINNGFISKSKARGLSTSDNIMITLDHMLNGTRQQESDALQLYNESCEAAILKGFTNPEALQAELLAYHGKKLNDSNVFNHEFLNNVYSAVMRRNMKNIGMYTYAVSAYLKKDDSSDTSAKKSPEYTALPLPVGKTQNIPGVWTVINKSYYSSEYGDRALIKLVNDKKEGVQFYIDGFKARDIEDGQVMTLRAGIKGVNTKGDMLTLTRVKMTLV